MGDDNFPVGEYACVMLPMDGQETTCYQILVRGQLDPCWSFWFDDFTITNQSGDSLLTGSISDQAALHGVLGRIRDLGLTLVSLHQIELSKRNLF
jgi:hypothetical protein